MPHYIWYLLLTIISGFILVIALYKTKSLYLVTMWLFWSGISYLFELVVFVFFRSYDYKPHVLSSSFHDSVLGSIPSQGLAVPIAASLVAVFNLSFLPIILIVLTFMGIEELFIKLGIYCHHWWKTLYTGLFLLPVFYISKAWLKAVKNNRSHFIFQITFFLILAPLVVTLTWIYFAVLRQYEFEKAIFEHFDRNNTALNAFYSLWLTGVYVLACQSGRKYGKLGYLLLLAAADFALVQSGMVVYSGDWSIYHFMATHILFLFLSCLLKEHLLPLKNKNTN